MAVARLRQVRPDRTAPLSRIRKIRGPNLTPQLGHDPARHQFDEADVTDLEEFRVQFNKENEKAKTRRQADHAGVPDQGLRRGTEEVPRLQLPRSTRTTRPDPQEVLQHRLRGRHAERPGGAGDQGCRQEGHLRDRARDGRAVAAKARDGKLGRPTCRADVHHLVARAASAALRSRRSSMRRKWRSSACAGRR